MLTDNEVTRIIHAGGLRDALVLLQELKNTKTTTKNEQGLVTINLGLDDMAGPLDAALKGQGLG